MEGLTEQEQELKEKKVNMEEELKEMKEDKKALYQELALIKVSKYLKTKVQKAFNIWRLRKQQSKVILTVINLM